MKYLFMVCTMLLTNLAIATPLAAIVTFESTAITPAGVTKQTRFQERLLRDNNIVWSERIVPQVTRQQEHLHQQEPHHHDLDFSRAGKWMELQNNQVSFRLVLREDKRIIEPRINEYGTLGFDGVWETAYYQINRAVLQTMQVINKPAAKDAVWYERKSEKEFTRILWDQKNEIPLTIESDSSDGNSNTKITFVLVAAPAEMPWQKLLDYETIAYEDLLD